MKSNAQDALIKRIIKTTDDGEYTYFLTQNEIHTGEVRYGVKIILKFPDKTYEEEGRALFCDPSRALLFLSFLAEHLVTPSNLPYVIEDTLDF